MPKALIAVGVVATVVAIGGMTYASIPGSDGIVRGCYQTSGGFPLLGTSRGTLRIVDADPNAGSGAQIARTGAHHPPEPRTRTGKLGRSLVCLGGV